MRTIIYLILVFVLICAGAVQAQIGSSISADGSAPNDNAMLDVQSPTTGDGKGILIPRVTLAQRTTSSATLAGGLLDNSGDLRGGAAQGLIVYQTDGVQGLYFNTSLITTPAWVYLGEETDPRWSFVSNAIVADIAARLSSNVWAASGSTTNYLPLTGGTMSGALNMGAQIVTNVAHISFYYTDVSVGAGANGSSDGAAMGYNANGSSDGAAVGYGANGSLLGVAVGEGANGYNFGAAVGYLAEGTNDGAAAGLLANGSSSGAAMGRSANGSSYGVAVGRAANGSSYGAAVGYLTTGTTYGAAVGRSANGSSYGAAVGNIANGSASGVAMGSSANGYSTGTALGTLAKGTNYGAAVGNAANGSDYGAAVGRDANGYYFGATVGYAANGYNKGIAVGREANGTNSGAALGYLANGAQTNVAIGAQANAQGGSQGTERIAIGHNVTNFVNDTAVIRGHIYLDGGTGMFYRATFGTGSWTAKAFEIDHPLDPENKILRHFCLEGPQVWNVYAGNAQLVNGRAVVQLPEYYSALNLVGSEIYSLTVVDESASQFPLVKVAKKVADNRFVITGTADVEVSWTIKVLRNDPGCREDLRRRPVEQMKNEIPNNRTAEQ